MKVYFYFSRYKSSYNNLRVLKTEIEHLQHLLEKSKVKLLKDFELWWAEQEVKAQVSRLKIHHILIKLINELK